MIRESLFSRSIVCQDFVPPRDEHIEVHKALDYDKQVVSLEDMGLIKVRLNPLSER